jgi:hypothetical protein
MLKNSFQGREFPWVDCVRGIPRRRNARARTRSGVNRSSSAQSDARRAECAGSLHQERTREHHETDYTPTMLGTALGIVMAGARLDLPNTGAYNPP